MLALGLGRSRAALGRLIGIFLAYGSLALTIYLASGLGELKPTDQPLGQVLLLTVGFLFVPSLGEELLWRWLLIPPKASDSPWRAAVAVLASTGVFVAAHPFAAWLFVPHAWETFTHPAFLAIVALLGIACGTSYVLSRSIWPPIAIHWVTILVWKFMLGGPFVLLGR